MDSAPPTIQGEGFGAEAPSLGLKINDIHNIVLQIHILVGSSRSQVEHYQSQVKNLGVLLHFLVDGSSGGSRGGAMGAQAPPSLSSSLDAMQSEC